MYTLSSHQLYSLFI